MDEVVRGPRQGHTLRSNLLKKYFNPRYGYVVCDIFNYVAESEIDELGGKLQSHWDDGMFTFTPGTLNKNSFSMLYSLNKHRRWEISDIVLEALDDVRGEDFRVVVYEREIPVSKAILHECKKYWAHCVAYSDSKGKKTAEVLPGKKSRLIDLRRICTGTVPPQKKKLPWEYHNKHWRGIQRKESAWSKFPRNGGVQNPKSEFTSSSLLNGEDNTAGCLEIRYEMGYPDKVHSRLNVLHNHGNYAIEHRVPYYQHFKRSIKGHKALKKTKGRKNNSNSWRFLQGNYYQQFKDELRDYREEMMSEKDTQFICTCAIKNEHQNNTCFCTCQWLGGDNCCCTGEYVYSDCEICSCHGNVLSYFKEDHDVSFNIELCTFFQNQNYKKRNGRKRQIKVQLDKNNTYPNTAMSKSVSRWFGKKEFILCEREEDELMSKSKTDEGSVHSESDSGISSTVETSSDLQTDTPSLTCYITHKSLRDCIMSGQCQLGQAVPLRCSFHLDIGNGNVESEFSLTVVEKLDHYNQQADTGVYLLRIHSRKEEQLLKDVMDNFQDSLTKGDVAIFSMEELLCIGQSLVKAAINSLPQSFSDGNDQSMKPVTTWCDGLFTSFDDIHTSGVPHLDLMGQITGQSVHFQIKTVQEAFDLLKDDQAVNYVDVVSVLEAILDTHSDLKSNDAVCDICLTSLEDGVEFSSLLPCRHLFCNTCMSYYIMERIRNGAQQIECLEHDCHTILDDITILSLIPSSVFKQWQQRKLERVVENSGKWTWCPNNSCDKVVAVLPPEFQSSTRNTSVQCVCSKTWCLNCQNEAHWPSTCDQAQTYSKLLQQNGDLGHSDEVRTVFVKVKRCPNCNYPIEKNGGCPSMACRCGELFCWICLTSWRVHRAEGWNMQCRRNVEETVIEISNNRVFSLPTQYYLDSVRHRKQWIEIRDKYVIQDVLRIVRRTDLREKVLSRTGWRKVWHKKIEIFRKDLYQNILYNLLLIRECHQFLERVYIVLSHSTRPMSVRNSMQKVVSKVEFIVDRLQEVTEELSSQEMKDHQKRLQVSLFQNLRLLHTQTIYLQNIIRKRNLSPSVLKKPSLDRIKFG